MPPPVCGNSIFEPPLEECDYTASNPDDPCQPYEYCTTGCECYDFRPDMTGCNYYDYCSDGNDPSNSSISCSSNWDYYCFTADEDQVSYIREICQDSSFVEHAWRTCGL